MSKVIKIQRAFRKIMCAIEMGDSVLAEAVPAEMLAKDGIQEDAQMEPSHLQIQEEIYAATGNELGPYEQASAISGPGEDGRKPHGNQMNRERAEKLRLTEKNYATQS